MRAAFYTLGCKVNQYDTQMMLEKLENNGYTICSFDETADVYIINTCTVTQISDKKSRNIISRAKRKNPNAIIVVCGCYSQVSPKETESIEGVDIVLGTRNRVNILDYIKMFQNTKTKITDTTNDGNLDCESITKFSEKTRAIIKIEDGCTNFCSYCLIPYARGKIISKPIDQILTDANSLALNGYKEIVLTGIHLSSYGKDLGNVDLADAINAVSQIPTIERIRLGSLEPKIITESFIEKIKKNKRLCPSFHLSLQSGCNKTLQTMNRKYTAEQYENSVNLLRNTFEDCSITTDIIVGFPGEDDTDFEECKNFAQKMSFSKIHIFPYSIRKGTKAAAMPNQIDKATKSAREKVLSDIEIESRKNFNSKMLGKTVEILVENFEDGVCNGYTVNYIQTKFEAGEDLCNKIVKVLITSSNENFLAGEIIEA